MAAMVGTIEEEILPLLELFHGRFDAEECMTLFIHNNRDVNATASFIISADTAALRQILDTTWTLVVRKRRVKQREPAIWIKIKGGRIAAECRLFACAACDKHWWRRVPKRKTVSKCKRCRQRYNPVPRNREWGIGDFQCPPPCGNKFKGWSQMDLVPSQCYQCHELRFPIRILPPQEEDQDGRGRRGRGGWRRSGSVHTHSCTAPDCYNRSVSYNNMAHGHNLFFGQRNGEAQRMWTCVHPKSRKHNNLPQVVSGSEEHESDGDTIATCLDQEDLMERYQDVCDPIEEEPEET